MTPAISAPVSRSVWTPRFVWQKKTRGFLFRSSSRIPPTRRSTDPVRRLRSWSRRTAPSTVSVPESERAGTITGIGEILKAKNPDIEIWAVEPEHAAILSGGSIGTHIQMGIGDGVIPEILNTDIYGRYLYSHRRGSHPRVQRSWPQRKESCAAYPPGPMWRRP